MSTINERIMQIINELNLNKNSFSIQTGLSSNTVVENIVSGRKSKPSFDVLFRIINTYDNINATWLITGKGSMFKNDMPNIVSEPIVNYGKCYNCEHKEQVIELQKENIETMQNLCKSKDIIIEELRNQLHTEDVSPEKGHRSA